MTMTMTMEQPRSNTRVKVRIRAKIRRKRSLILVQNAITKWRLSQRDGEYCNHCKVRMDAINLTIDHVKPKFLGGSDELANKQLLCLPCHRKKSLLEQKGVNLAT